MGARYARRDRAWSSQDYECCGKGVKRARESVCENAGLLRTDWDIV